MGGSSERIWVKKLGRCNKCMCWCCWRFLSKDSDSKRERLRQQSNGLLLRILRALWRELSRDLWRRRKIFVFFCVASPGKSNDALSFFNAGCHEILRDLPFDTYFVGDAVFELSENLITPFTGPQRENNLNNSFNFFLSQARIRIGISFTRLSSKFRFSYMLNFVTA